MATAMPPLPVALLLLLLAARRCWGVRVSAGEQGDTPGTHAASTDVSSSGIEESGDRVGSRPQQMKAAWAHDAAVAAPPAIVLNAAGAKAAEGAEFDSHRAIVNSVAVPSVVMFPGLGMQTVTEAMDRAAAAMQMRRLEMTYHEAKRARLFSGKFPRRGWSHRRDKPDDLRGNLSQAAGRPAKPAAGASKRRLAGKRKQRSSSTVSTSGSMSSGENSTDKMWTDLDLPGLRGAAEKELTRLTLIGDWKPLKHEGQPISFTPCDDGLRLTVWFEAAGRTQVFHCKEFSFEVRCADFVFPRPLSAGGAAPILVFRGIFYVKELAESESKAVVG